MIFHNPTIKGQSLWKLYFLPVFVTFLISYLIELMLSFTWVSNKSYILSPFLLKIHFNPQCYDILATETFL